MSNRTCGHRSDAAGRLRPASAAVAAFALTLCATGCATTHGQLLGFRRAYELSEATGHYTVLPPDAITIHAPNAPEVDGTTQTIRPDGKVVLRLLGEVHVSGLTTQEIRDKIRTQLSRYYIDPEVEIEIALYRSQHYYVFGEVSSPGRKRFTGRDSLLKALADARPTFLAWRSRIRVVRPALEPDDRKVITVDLDRMLRTGEVDQNVLLQPGDIIEVPPTPLAWVGHRVRELLYPLSPALRAYGVPSDALDRTDTYQDHFDNSSSDDED